MYVLFAMTCCCSVVTFFFKQKKIQKFISNPEIFIRQYNELILFKFDSVYCYGFVKAERVVYSLDNYGFPIFVFEKTVVGFSFVVVCNNDCCPQLSDTSKSNGSKRIPFTDNSIS
jgi:hypothetical protein